MSSEREKSFASSSELLNQSKGAMSLIIRPEQAADAWAIRELTISAFTHCELGYHGEAEIIERLRAFGPELLSLVALINNRIVGHILFSPVRIEGNGPICTGMGLAPISVLPEFQNQGIGSQLIEKGLELLAAKSCPFVVVLGHAAFYSRFGFEPAKPLGIVCEFAGIPDEIFRIKLLSISREDLTQGTARYCGEFAMD
jgi:putative acetyltransferase